MTEQEQLEQAIANVDKVVSGFQCDRQTRGIIETGWQLIVQAVRKRAEPPKVKGKPEPTPAATPTASRTP